MAQQILEETLVVSDDHQIPIDSPLSGDRRSPSPESATPSLSRNASSSRLNAGAPEFVPRAPPSPIHGSNRADVHHPRLVKVHHGPPPPPVAHHPFHPPPMNPQFAPPPPNQNSEYFGGGGGGFGEQDGAPVLIESDPAPPAAEGLSDEVTRKITKQRAGLKSMMQFEDWLNSKFSNIAERMKMEKIILDNDFWRKLQKFQTTISPLVRVLRMVDDDKDPSMGLIYDALDRAKIAISEVNESKPERYMKYWKIIDARWESTLHSPLHAAGYFQNTVIRYREDFSEHLDVRRGLQTVIGKLFFDMDCQLDALSEIIQFEQARGDFGRDIAIKSRT